MTTAAPLFTDSDDRDRFIRDAAEGLDILPCPLCPHLAPQVNFIRGAFDRLLWFVTLEAEGNSDWDVCGPSCRNPAEAVTVWNRAMGRIS